MAKHGTTISLFLKARDTDSAIDHWHPHPLQFVMPQQVCEVELNGQSLHQRISSGIFFIGDLRDRHLVCTWSLIVWWEYFHYYLKGQQTVFWIPIWVRFGCLLDAKNSPKCTIPFQSSYEVMLTTRQTYLFSSSLVLQVCNICVCYERSLSRLYHVL